MAITTTEQTAILKTVSALFNKAFTPETTTKFFNFYESNGKDLGKLADGLIGSAAYVSLYNGAGTIAEYGAILMAKYGLTYGGASAADTAMTNFINYSFANAADDNSVRTIQAVDKYIVATLIPSITAGNIFETMNTAITNKATVYETFKNDAANAGKELSLASVTADPASMDLPVVLTNGSDILTGVVFTAGLVYTPGGDDRINALQDEDNLLGQEGKATSLTAELGNPNDNGDEVITPTLTNIQTVNVAFTANNTTSGGMTLDMQDANGTEVLNITRVASGANSASVINMEDQTDTISVSDSNAFANITLGYLNSTVSMVEVTVNNVRATAMTVGAGAGASEDLETLNIYSTGSADIINVLTSDDAATMTITATDSLTIGDVDAAVTAMTVSGAGDITLGLTGAISTDNTLVLSGATQTGNLTADIAAVSDSAATSITSGFGDDVIDTDGADLAGDITTNDGDDTVTVEEMAVTASIATGAGNDTVSAGVMVGSIDGGASIDTGAGEDIVSITSLGEEGSVNLGDDNDILNINPITGVVTAGDTPGGLDVDDTPSLVDLGAGDDTININLNGSSQVDLNNLALSTRAIFEGETAGNTGTDTINVTGTRSAVVTEDVAGTQGNITGIEILNLTSEASYDAVRVNSINNTTDYPATPAANIPDIVTVTDDDAFVADYEVNLNAFDADLDTINITHLDGVVRNKASEEPLNTTWDGEAATYTLFNLDGETITVVAEETEAINDGGLTTVNGQEAVTDTTGTENLRAVFGADVLLQLSDDATIVGSAVTVEMKNSQLNTATDAANATNYDMAIDDIAANLTDLTLVVSTTTASRQGVDLSNDFDGGSLTLTGAGTVTDLDILNVNATTITTTAYGTSAQNLYLGIENGTSHTINTGATNDIVRLGDHVVALAIGAVVNDTINLGAGDDILIFNQTGKTAGLSIGDRVNGEDGNDVLAFAGEGSNVTTNGNTESNIVKLDTTEFQNVSNFEIFRFGLTDNSETGVDTANHADRYDIKLSDNIIEANDNTTDNMLYIENVNDNTGMIVDLQQLSYNYQINFTGSDAVDRIIMGETIIDGNDVLAGGTNLDDVIEVRNSAVLVTSNDFQSISGFDILDFTNNTAVNQELNITIDSALGSLNTINVNVEGTAQSAGTFAFTSAAGATMTLNIDNVANESFNITANGDFNYTYTDTFGATTIINTAVANVISTGNGNDTIYAGSGADTITGGAGADTIIGGADADLFIFANTGDTGVTTATADTITDFTTAEDTIDFDTLAAGAGNFAAVDANTGAGDDIATVELAAATTTTTLYTYLYDSVDGVNAYLLIDNTLDGTVDQVVVLTGLGANAVGLVATDIIA